MLIYPGTSVRLEELREVWRSEFRKGLETEDKNLKMNEVLDR